MKRIILLGFLIIALTTNAQDFYSSGDCKASFKFEVNPNIYTLLPATAINFYDTSEGNIKAWYWDCGDSITSTEQNPMFVFNHPISGPTVKISPYRKVSLTIVTENCKSTVSQLINIIDGTLYQQNNCFAKFDYYEMSRDSAAETATIVFNNYSEGKDLQYYWKFGDGQTSTDKEPIVKLSLNQPEYKVCLTVTGSDNCSSVFCAAVYLEKPEILPQKCEVAFGYERKEILMSLLPSAGFDFYYKPNTEVKEWYWNFGDGETSNEPNPTHIFTQLPVDSVLGDPNPFREVCLTVITTEGCEVSHCEKINVFDFGPQPPVPFNCRAEFKYSEMSRDSAAGTAKIRFDNYSEGTELSYIWQFGNGIETNEKDPIITFKTDLPEYKVCLTVSGPEHCTHTTCQPVYMQYPVIDPVEPECTVDFYFDRKDILMSPLPSAVFDFYYRSHPEVKEWYWEFGDGTTSNEPNPTHVYIKPVMSDSMKVMYNPFRTVCLTIKTADECKITDCQTIQVFDYNPEPEKCPVYFKYSQPDDVVSIPEVVPIKLEDVSGGDVISRLWQFEDGTTSTDKEPLVSFNAFQSVHNVCLTVTFADSCTNTFCDAVYVNGGIIDTIIVDPVCPYTIKVDGGFPIQMSSCAGWASAQVYLADSAVTPKIFYWSTGDTLANMQGLCPTQTYTVKALMPDGCIVYSNFIFNSDGSVTPINPVPPVMSVIWRLSGEREKTYVRPEIGKGMKVEWRLCDGTTVEADSISLDAINCGGNMMNMIVKDSLGNIVYTENIALKGTVTSIKDLKVEPAVKLWPNPVSNKLNIRYSGEYQPEINVEVCDIMGRRISVENYYNISDGHEFSIDTEDLKQGIYVCRISSVGKTIHSEKFSRR